MHINSFLVLYRPKVINFRFLVISRNNEKIYDGTFIYCLLFDSSFFMHHIMKPHQKHRVLRFHFLMFNKGVDICQKFTMLMFGVY